MPTLYKKTKKTLEYYRILERFNEIYIYRGVVGEVGTLQKKRRGLFTSVKGQINKELEIAKSLGFSELPEREFKVITVKSVHEITTPEEFAKRNNALFRLRSEISDLLENTVNGYYCDSRINSEFFEIYFYVIEEKKATAQIERLSKKTLKITFLD